MQKPLLFSVAVALLATISGVAFAKPPSSGSVNPGAQAAPNVPVSPAVAALLSAYPQGGPGLTAAVAAALLNDPSLAAAIVAIGNQGNPEQMAAIALGLLQAIEALNRSNPTAAQSVRLALQGANPIFRAVLAALSAQRYAQGGISGGTLNYFGGGFSSGGGGGGIGVGLGGGVLATPN